MRSKNFKQRTTAKFPRPNPVRDFFLNQAIEWHETGFTCREMAEEMQKYGFYPEWDIKSVQTRLYGHLHRYCNEFDDRKSILEPIHAKKYKIKTMYI